jgi:hypothetical protein
MTAHPLQPPRRLLTVAAFAAFHEADEGRVETAGTPFPVRLDLDRLG